MKVWGMYKNVNGTLKPFGVDVAATSEIGMALMQSEYKDLAIDDIKWEREDFNNSEAYRSRFLYRPLHTVFPVELVVMCVDVLEAKS